jgi:RNA polymerase sigma factor (sigma-70 family)
MAGEALKTLLQHLKRIALPQGGSGLSDAELLGRWLAARDEAAFEVLVWRHGPMVLRLHRRLLCRAQDIEDAFQATFLALVRKAGSIRRPEAVASWLYRVAYRVALRVRAGAVQRAARETGGLDLLAIASKDCSSEESWRTVLDEEVHRLPARYRATVVLCYLEGRTNEEAAGELGCPVGTIFSRLASARQLLQRRLRRRGLALGTALAAIGLDREAVAAPLASPWVDAALRAGHWTASGKGSAISARVLALTEGVCPIMFLARGNVAAAVVVTLAIVGAGFAAIIYTPSVDGPRDRPQAVAGEPAAPAPEQLKTWYEPASQRDGVLLVFGTEVKHGQKVPSSRLVTMPIGGEARQFQRFHEGDSVEPGQLVAQLDDQLARTAAAKRQAKLLASEAELTASIKVRDEAKLRYETQARLAGPAASDEDIRAAKLTWERYVSEAAAKEEAVTIARLEWQQAQTIVDMHQIRSRGRGIIQAVYRQPGEAVRALEPICKIELGHSSGKPAEGAPGQALRPYQVPTQQAGILLVIGTRLRPGESVPADGLVTITRDGKTVRYRPLGPDDRVEAAQVIAQLDDRLAQREVTIKAARLGVIEADLVASEATRDEAKRRYETQCRLLEAGATTQEDQRAARVVYERYVAEAAAKTALVRVAELEWKEAQAVLAQYQIRSVVGGVIKAVYKQAGEGVKYLDPVFRIEPFEDSRSADGKQERLAAPPLVEPGVLDGLTKVDVKCEVKTSGSKGTKISWVATEGSVVKKGDLLIEFADSKNSKIYAPQAGVVVYKQRPKIATRGDSVAYGQQLLALYDLSHMVVSIQVPAASAQGLTPGLQATVQPDAFPDKKLRAHLKSVARVASPQDGKYQAIVYIDDSVEGLDLKPGMTARVTLLTKAKGKQP